MPATKFGAQQSGIGRLVGEAPRGGKSDVNGRCGEFLGLQLQPISQHDGRVQGQARFRAIPFNEFVHGMLVRAAGLEGCEAIEDGPLGLIEFR